MTRFIATIFGAAITVAATDLAAMAAPPDASPTTTARADWSDGGRWLTPHEIKGYDGGYAVNWPGAPRTVALPPRKDTASTEGETVTK